MSDRTQTIDAGAGDLGIAVVGLGYWGPNLVRNFTAVEGARVVRVADLDPVKVESITRHYPAVEPAAGLDEVLADPRVGAVVVATPPGTHYPVAHATLEGGRHVLVEKPLAHRADEAADLVRLADELGLTLMVDHTFIYTSAVRRAHELVNGGTLGDLYYYDAIRANLGLFQQDVNVIWDLAVHDLSIMDHLLAREPLSVRAMGARHVAGERENLAYLHLEFDGSLIAHIAVNWLAPVKVRLTMIGGSQRMLIYDDTEADEKIKVYDKSVVVSAPSADEAKYRTLFDYRTGDMWAPKVDQTEALRRVAEHFTACVASGEAPITDGRAGLRIVRILEAAQRSLDEDGRSVALGEVAGALSR
jgi:predicted dehydrogenase